MASVKTEPVVSAAALSGIIVGLASVFNVVLDLTTVQTLVVALLPLVLSFVARGKVTPVA